MPRGGSLHYSQLVTLARPDIGCRPSIRTAARSTPVLRKHSLMLSIGMQLILILCTLTIYHRMQPRQRRSTVRHVRYAKTNDCKYRRAIVGSDWNLLRRMTGSWCDTISRCAYLNLEHASVLFFC